MVTLLGHDDIHQVVTSDGGCQKALFGARYKVSQAIGPNNMRVYPLLNHALTDTNAVTPPPSDAENASRVSNLRRMLRENQQFFRPKPF